MRRPGLRSFVPAILGASALAVATLVHAQATQVIESKDIGARMTVPKDWEARERSSDLFVDCAPGKNQGGRPACYMTITDFKAAPGQAAITDADRAKWKDASSAHGMRTILSAEDTRVGGLPAYHIVVKQGKRADDTVGSWVYVLVAAKPKVLRVTYDAILDPADYERYKPAFMKALQTLAPIP